MKTTLHLCALLLVAAAILPRARQGAWWIRIFDFPRLQLVGAALLVLLGYRFVEITPLGAALQGALAAVTVYQIWRIHPYTPLAPLQVEHATKAEHRYSNVRLMVANVYMPNRNAAALLAMVRRERPDLLLTVETDGWWDANLRELEGEYPHMVRHPLPNTYGMLLFSRHPLLRPEVRFLVEDDVPSIYAAVDVPDCPNVQLYCLHPRPPRPSKRQDSTNRDAELVIVGRQVRDSGDPVIVAGDLNDVAWSYTTDLFQRLSGLLDPRRGRGMFNTFNAKIPLLRFPLDHVFHSAHFRLVRLERLPRFGSDHFPILVELSYERSATQTQTTPEAERDDLAMGREMVERARRRER